MVSWGVIFVELGKLNYMAFDLIRLLHVVSLQCPHPLPYGEPGTITIAFASIGSNFLKP